MAPSPAEGPAWTRVGRNDQEPRESDEEVMLFQQTVASDREALGGLGSGSPCGA